MRKVKIRIGSTGIFILILMVLYLAGCASIPTKLAKSSYTINGVSYLSLVYLCDAKGINWEYDLITRNIILAKGSHKINLRVGEKMILVDGQPQFLKHPVDLYQGVTIVPSRFKEQVIDALFADYKKNTVAPVVPLNLKKVIIDAGHGGKDPGALGRSGSREKNIALDIALRLATILRKQGVEVVLTRPSDAFVSLSRRVEITNNSQADLFISIHVNANRVRSLNGFEVYHISSDLNDPQRALSAAKSAKFKFDNYCLAYPSLELKATLWDMIYTSNRAEAMKLAQNVCDNIDKDIDVRVIGIKSAHFMVLKGSRIPAILIEVGFISNPQEEGFLKNGYYRQKIAESIDNGIVEYSRGLYLSKASSN